MAPKLEKPLEDQLPSLTPTPRGLICVVCGAKFERGPNNVARAKICLPANAPHKKVEKVLSNGETKKVCECCRCVYKKTLGKQRTVEGKIIPLSRLPEFLETTRRMQGEEILLAFRATINAMLRVQELRNLRADCLDLTTSPLPTLYVVALKKKVKMRFPVSLDVRMAQDLKTYIDQRKVEQVFDFPVRTLQHKCKQVLRRMGLPKLSIHSLRHTGISNRAQSVTNLNELNYLRVQARHESIETTKLYLGLEAQQQLEMSQKINWV